MTQTAIYARISRDTEGTALGVTRQVEDCRAKAAALGWTVVSERIDNDLSASKAGVHRPEYEALLADLGSGKVGALVVFDLDRLTRKPAELETFMSLADERGIALANVSGEVDLTTSGGRLIARIKGAVARQEAERIGERVTRALRQRAERGLPQPGPVRVYGYSRDWEVVPAEAAVVVEVFERKAAGESLYGIAEDLTGRGLRTVSGKPFGSAMILHMLKKPGYAGRRLYRGEVISATSYPPIISESLWEAAQKSLRKSGTPSGANSRKHLLSGFLRCSACSGPLGGGVMLRSGRKEVRYFCTSKHPGRVTTWGDWCERAVVSAVLLRVSRCAPISGPRNYEVEVEGVDREIENLRAAYGRGDLDLADLTPLLKSARDKRREILASVPTVPSAIAAWEDWPEKTLSERRALISQHLHAIVLSRGRGADPSRLSVHWNSGEIETLADPGNYDPERRLVDLGWITQNDDGTVKLGILG